MKRIVHTLLIAAAVGMPEMLYAQDEAAPTQAAATSGNDAVAAARAKISEQDARVAEFKEPSRSFGSRYESLKKDLENQIKRVEEARKKHAAAKEKLAEISAVAYTFTVVPDESRYLYENEGVDKVAKVTGLLNSRDMAEQMEGIEQFEAVNAEFQGIPGYLALRAQYKSWLDKNEKKWNAAKQKALRDRQKMNASTRTKAETNEENVYRRLAKKMESMDKDVTKHWFVPGGSMMSNTRLLDLLLQRVSEARRVISNEPAEGADKGVAMLRAYWDAMDALASSISAGQLSEAEEKCSDNEAIEAIRTISRFCMPEKYKQPLVDQYRKLRDDIRTRKRETDSVEREVRRTEQNVESLTERLGASVEKLIEVVDNEKEALDRKAEEEAERKAEEDARKAEEAEDDEEDAKPAQKAKSAKKSGKKSAAKKS